MAILSKIITTALWDAKYNWGYSLKSLVDWRLWKAGSSLCSNYNNQNHWVYKKYITVAVRY